MQLQIAALRWLQYCWGKLLLPYICIWYGMFWIPQIRLKVLFSYLRADSIKSRLLICLSSIYYFEVFTFRVIWRLSTRSFHFFGLFRTESNEVITSRFRISENRYANCFNMINSSLTELLLHDSYSLCSLLNFYISSAL